MSTHVEEKLLQRADYTHKFNAKTGRHGWLRLTPAYSVKMVEELMGYYQKPLRVLDPFCGTATTVLSAAYHGHEGVTTDINPFLVWLGQAKTKQYSEVTITSARHACNRIIQAVTQGDSDSVKAPPIHNIERWWHPQALEFLCRLRRAIESESGQSTPERTLLLAGFCRTLIQLSSASFGHQSMSFRDDGQLLIPFNEDMEKVFSRDMRFILDGASQNPDGTAQVILGDARELSDTVEGPFDLVITSPPYANRMSYIRELRPYMYWLGFLDNGRSAGEMDWSAIGGTWGLATSRLSDWTRSPGGFEHPLLDEILEKIADDGNRNGRILANYVAKYFDDMWKHFNSLTQVLSSDSEVHYIVGNSSFYGVLLSVEEFFKIMLERLGFGEIESRAVRKRNSKKELFEFDVSAKWSGSQQRDIERAGRLAKDWRRT